MLKGNHCDIFVLNTCISLISVPFCSKLYFFFPLPDVDSNDEGGPDGSPVEEEAWFGNASDTRSESSSYGDTQDELLLPRGSSPDERPGVSTGSGDHDTCGGESSVGCPTPVHRASLELLGLDGSAFSAQDTLSSVVSSLYGEAASRALGKPLSSNLRRLLEAGSLKLDTGELLGRSSRGGAGGGVSSNRSSPTFDALPVFPPCPAVKCSCPKTSQYQ